MPCVVTNQSAVPSDRVVGLYEYRIPKGGYVLNALHNPWVLGLLIASPVLWLISGALFGRARLAGEVEEATAGATPEEAAGGDADKSGWPSASPHPHSPRGSWIDELPCLWQEHESLNAEAAALRTQLEAVEARLSRYTTALERAHRLYDLLVAARAETTEPARRLPEPRTPRFEQSPSSSDAPSEEPKARPAPGNSDPSRRPARST